MSLNVNRRVPYGESIVLTVSGAESVVDGYNYFFLAYKTSSPWKFGAEGFQAHPRNDVLWHARMVPVGARRGRGNRADQIRVRLYPFQIKFRVRGRVPLLGRATSFTFLLFH